MSYGDQRLSWEFPYRTEAEQVYRAATARGLSVSYAEPHIIAFYRAQKPAIEKVVESVQARALNEAPWPSYEAGTLPPTARSHCAECGSKLKAAPLHATWCDERCLRRFVTHNLSERFRALSKVNGSCVHWTGPRDIFGLPRVPKELPSGEIVFMDAQRLAWNQFHGAIPPDHYIQTKCQNPACLGAGHLYLKARGLKRALRPQYKFTGREIMQLQQDHAGGASLTMLRKKYHADVLTVKFLLTNTLALE